MRRAAVRSTRRLKVTVEACRPPRIFPSSVPPSDASTIYFLPKFNDGYLTICPGPFNDSNHSITPLEMSPKKTQGWVEQLSLLIDIEGREPDWLWIAWEFGITAVFNRVGERLAFGAPIPETKPASSAFTSPGGAFGVSRPQVSYLNELSKVSTVSSFSSMALPPGVEESITRMRERMIECMLTGLYEYSEALIDWVNDPNPSVSSPQVQRCAHSKRDCVALQFGSLTLGLSEDLWPRRDAKDVPLSPAQLRTRLLDIKLSDCENNDFKQTRRDGRHSSKQAKVYCGDFGKISKRIEDVPFQQPPFANDMQLNHLTDRFAIVGISCDFVPVPILRKQKTENRINIRS
nr:uncharacterized protein CTRU02_05587 [Colletotrichum truncatum]KAF6794030.1 hypothetical protein CTRU02_05587 [Colletotrichum truncatum]